MADRAYLERLTRELADEGKLIEAGWVSLRLAAISPNASPAQLTAMRMAYMAGAQHLYASLMTMTDSAAGPTEADLRKMDLLNAELQAYGNELLQSLPTAGRG